MMSLRNSACPADAHARCTPWIYWLTVVLVSIVGTQITDLLTDGLGVSLYVSTSVFAVALAAIFTIWYRIEGTLSIDAIDTPQRELFYWSAILCTFALGTAAGDLATEALGLGFSLGTVVFGVLLALVYVAWSSGNAVLTFWIAYILADVRCIARRSAHPIAQLRRVRSGCCIDDLLFLSVIIVLVAFAQFGASSRACRRSSDFLNKPRGEASS
jgi:uncharacterized membrane-anchored protein